MPEQVLPALADHNVLGDGVDGFFFAAMQHDELLDDALSPDVSLTDGVVQAGDV